MADSEVNPVRWPKPDPETGLPRPPHAPNFIGNRKLPDGRSGRDTDAASKPAPPPGQGPVLAWYRSSKRGALSSGIIGVFLIMVLLYFMKGFNVRVFEVWWIWLLAIGAGVGVYSSIKVEWLAAGAEWFTYRKSWVRIYELTEIKTRFYSNTIYVYLTDADGRRVDAPLQAIQQDRLIWDLLYNGIRHSIVNGAVLKGTARHYFSAA